MGARDLMFDLKCLEIKVFGNTHKTILGESMERRLTNIEVIAGLHSIHGSDRFARVDAIEKVVYM